MTRQPSRRRRKVALAIVAVILMSADAFVAAGCVQIEDEESAAVPGAERRTAMPALEEPVPDSPPEAALDSMPQPELRSARDGVYTEEQARRGEAVYERACALCHLKDLAGGGMAPALVGTGTVELWKGRSVGDVYAIIRSTMPEGAPASLSRQEYIDVVAYLLEVNAYPAGGDELTLDRPTLDRTTLGRN